MKPVILQPGPQAWLSSSVLSAYQDSYVTRLREDRYAHNVIRVYLASVAHFARWLGEERVDLSSLDTAVLDRFLNNHLPVCSCPSPVRRTRYELRTAIRHLLRLLEAEGVIRSAGKQDGLSRELAAFDAYMRDVAGLAETTRRQRGLIVGRFLAHTFGAGAVIVSKIDAASVRQFVLGEGRDWGAGAVRVAGSSIGGYLKYRQMSGDDVGKLLQAIPRAAHWRLASLPEILSPAQIDALLASFNADLPSRRRAYAMVRCATDLGLRCAEVVKLCIEDIDFRNGTIRIARSKTHFTYCLPLPKMTGEAIADYLRHERPETVNRAIFVRHVAPYDRPVQAGVAKRAVIAAFRRCGWDRCDPHVLRHSVASRLLREGTPMKHIADILRHRSLDTSKIYTKIDLDRLSAVALPWPGRE
ncbi:tyrosine-type recombinase/integrase [Brucella pseudogrignonensis]|uniref:tyrosine-type recombinase/integrase n=1 Tax=Brucella pseudogrignonensis TaxID=419475 RepID=UPI001E349EF0|nr:tyrosine-type recombinase/integrase [Brucella pseudogrignonensis]MCD4511768.1 tyrosine-type recombinase/integrase [Brucella pseudogrignonensis]